MMPTLTQRLRAIVKAEWHEEQHPRDHGKFSSKPGAEGGGSDDASSDKPEQTSDASAKPTSKPKQRKPEAAAGGKSEPKEGDVMEFPPTANGRRGFSLQVEKVDDNHAYLKFPGSDYTAVKIPRESLKQYRDDMMGIVDAPRSDDIPEINKVIDGSAKLLGHGDDGMAFDAGDKIIKVSSVVPFHPTNSVGQRTPEQAIDQARRQFETAKEMFRAGVPGIMRQSVRQLGDKVFTVRDKLDIPEKFTAEQVEQVRQSLNAMHKAGYTLNDEIQVGIANNGHVYHFDTGKAARATHKDDYKDDSERFERWAAEHVKETLPLYHHADRAFSEALQVISDSAAKRGGKPNPALASPSRWRYINEMGRAIIADEPSRADEIRGKIAYHQQLAGGEKSLPTHLRAAKIFPEPDNAAGKSLMGRLKRILTA